MLTPKPTPCAEFIWPPPISIQRPYWRFHMVEVDINGIVERHADLCWSVGLYAVFAPQSVIESMSSDYRCLSWELIE